MNQSQKGYVAGIIDGEGYIGIQDNGRQIRIVVTSTCEELLSKLATITGLGYYARCSPRKDRSRVPAWQWFCFGQNAVTVLRKIHSLLIIKHEQASLVLRFANYLKSRRFPRAPMSERDASVGLHFAKQIKALNSKERNKQLRYSRAIEEADLWKFL